MLKMILIRHGEEEKEKLNNIKYQTDNSVLTSNGIWQVKRLALKLKEQNISKIYSSDIKRALQTAEMISQEIGAKIRIDKRLREINLGEFEKYGDNWRKHFNELKEKELAKGVPLTEIRPPGGENLYDFRERVKSLLRYLSKKTGNILVSAHKGVNTAVINFAHDWNTKEFKSTEQNHACVNVLSFENDKWNILTINDITHLKENEI